MTIGNLPADSNTFIGRERDLVDLGGILDRARMLTLCGPGGIGKTRLAIRLGAYLSPRFPDGAWIVDLTGAETPERLLPLVCTTLGVQAESDRPLIHTLAEALRPRTMLLILDTCEHLVAEAAGLAEWLLAHCPGLQVIATSTEPLRARGEVIWRVPPLGLPPMTASGRDDEQAMADAVTSDAVRLFIARAASARPGFELQPGNCAAVTAICRTLDGVPLAIELAAARLRTLSVEQIRQRLVSRFELLAVGDRTAPRRQQTLRATVEWSYDLLSKPERLLLSRLSVFRGWSLELAERVCSDEEIPQADVLDLLTALIDKSLVTVDYELQADARYGLLDTVRQFATEQTEPAELGKMREAHRDGMLALAESLVSFAMFQEDMSWPDRVRAYRRSLVDLTNLSMALEYCAERDDAEQGLRFCNALRVVWLISGEHGDSVWLDRFLGSDAPVSPGVRSRSLVVRAEIAFEQRDFGSIAGYARQALELSKAGPDGNPGGAERMLALAALTAGQPAEAMLHAEAAIATARKLGTAWECGVAFVVLAGIHMATGNANGARQAYLDAIDVLGESRGWAVANVRYGLGRIARADGNPAEASRYFAEALSLYGDVSAQLDMARCLASLGQLALEQDDLSTASDNLTESMELSLLTGQRSAIVRGLAALAAVVMAAGEPGQAVQLAGASRQLLATISAPHESTRRRLDALIDAATAVLGQDEVAVLLAEAKPRSPDQVARRAMDWLRRRFDLSEADGRADDEAARQVSEWEPAAFGERPNWPGPLTDREREVALLVARGWSNRAIGEELSITLATASRHIANIYRKLGFTSRAQLTAWVLSSGSA